MGSPILSDERFDAPYELPAIAATLVARSEGAGVTAADFVTAIGATARRAPAGEFPTTIERTVRRCGEPTHDLQRFAEQFVCHGAAKRYEEITAAAYGWWTPIPDSRAPGVQSYLKRIDGFTIASLRDLLPKGGYTEFGIVEPQSSVHGFPTPLVHTAFRHEDRGPVVIAGHRPEQVQDSPIDGRPPAVVELRFYFSDGGMK